MSEKEGEGEFPFQSLKNDVQPKLESVSMARCSFLREQMWWNWQEVACDSKFDQPSLHCRNRLLLEFRMSDRAI